ncbi:unnamed protein product [Closterium sp. NIES-54]
MATRAIRGHVGKSESPNKALEQFSPFGIILWCCRAMDSVLWPPTAFRDRSPEWFTALFPHYPAMAAARECETTEQAEESLWSIQSHFLSHVQSQQSQQQRHPMRQSQGLHVGTMLNVPASGSAEERNRRRKSRLPQRRSGSGTDSLPNAYKSGSAAPIRFRPYPPPSPTSSEEAHARRVLAEAMAQDWRHPDSGGAGGVGGEKDVKNLIIPDQVVSNLESLRSGGVAACAHERRGSGSAVAGVVWQGEGPAEGTAEGAAEGTAEGAAEGTVEGAAEGAAEGTAEGAAKRAAEGTAEGAAEGAADATTENSAVGVGGGTQAGEAGAPQQEPIQANGDGGSSGEAVGDGSREERGREVAGGRDLREQSDPGTGGDMGTGRETAGIGPSECSPEGGSSPAVAAAAVAAAVEAAAAAAARAAGEAGGAAEAASEAAAAG